MPVEKSICRAHVHQKNNTVNQSAVKMPLYTITCWNGCTAASWPRTFEIRPNVHFKKIMTWCHTIGQKHSVMDINLHKVMQKWCAPNHSGFLVDHVSFFWLSEKWNAFLLQKHVCIGRMTHFIRSYRNEVLSKFTQYCRLRRSMASRHIADYTTTPR